MKLLIIGAGGHAKVVLDAALAAGHQVVGLTDDDRARCGRSVADFPVLHPDDILARHPPGAIFLVNGVGGYDSTEDRRRVYEQFRSRGYQFAVLTAPSAHLSPSARLAPGAQVLTRAILHPDAAVGENAVINTAAVVEHDCAVGSHSFVGPAAVLCGKVQVGDGAFIGAGAILLPGVRVAAGCVVGAGAVVTKDLAAGSKVVGVPAGPL